jgi:hypothetical protein
MYTKLTPQNCYEGDVSTLTTVQLLYEPCSRAGASH